MPVPAGVHRRAVHLCTVRGLSLRAAASKLGVSHQTVKNILARKGFTKPKKWEASK